MLAKAGELLLACYGRSTVLVLGLHLSLCTFVECFNSSNKAFNLSVGLMVMQAACRVFKPVFYAEVLEVLSCVLWAVVAYYFAWYAKF